jgi:hypothetical protein
VLDFCFHGTEHSDFIKGIFSPAGRLLAYEGRLHTTDFVTGHFMCTCIRDFTSGSLGIQKLKDGGRTISLLSTAVKQLKLAFRWNVTNQYLIRCNESECKQKLQNNCYFCNVTDCTMHHESFVTLSV